MGEETTAGDDLAATAICHTAILGDRTRRFVGNVTVGVASGVVFLAALWFGMVLSLVGGYALGDILSSTGVHRVLGDYAMVLICFFGLPAIATAYGLWFCFLIVRRKRGRTVLAAGSIGFMIGSTFTLIFMLCGGWGGMFG